jgi:hypothetical protein
MSEEVYCINYSNLHDGNYVPARRDDKWVGQELAPLRGDTGTLECTATSGWKWSPLKRVNKKKLATLNSPSTVYVGFIMLKVKVPVMFSGTKGFPARRDARYIMFHK